MESELAAFQAGYPFALDDYQVAACEHVARGSKSRPAGYVGWDFDARAIKTASRVLAAPFADVQFPLKLLLSL